MTKQEGYFYGLRVVLLCTLWLCPVHPLLAQDSGTSTWTASGTGDWFTSGNWSDGVPDSSITGFVSNSGTVVISSGSATDYELYVGTSGTGGLLVSGGNLQSAFDMVFGQNAGSSGSATISGGTVGFNQMITGYYGSGTVTITGGSVVNTMGFGGLDVIGDMLGSVGTVNVSGGTYSVYGMYVGDQGEGNLDVTGGEVDVTDMFVGANPGASSTLLITGGTVNVSGTMVVGSGTGTVSISNAGTLIIDSGTGTLVLGFQESYSKGTLTLDGTSSGMLEAAEVTGAVDNTVVNFIQSGSYNFVPKLSGLLGINQGGDGTTELARSESYTGDTTVSAGTLLLSGAGSVYSSAVINVMQGATLDVTGVTGGNYQIKAGQTLGGGGLVNATNISIFGNLSPGLGQTTGVASLTINGIVSLGGSATFTVYANGTSDSLNVTGGLIAYGGTLAITLSGVLSSGSHVFTLFSATSTVGDFSGVTVDNTALSQTSANTWTGSFTDNGTTYAATFTNPANSDGMLTLVAVPEPAALVLLGLAGVACLLVRARRTAC